MTAGNSGSMIKLAVAGANAPIMRRSSKRHAMWKYAPLANPLPMRRSGKRRAVWVATFICKSKAQADRMERYFAEGAR
jgi:hypothetical protein